MAKKKTTAKFSAWLILIIFGLIAIFTLGAILMRLFAPPQPLADRASLAALIAGRPLPKPAAETLALFNGAKLTPPDPSSLETNVLGATNPTLTATDLSKRIEVDLTNQKVYAFEGDKKVFEFPVSTGKWGPTPVGQYHIWVKVKSQLMSGGNTADGTYYYLPNVPWVMFFYNNQVPQSRGYSLHGTYWHNNFGHPMSHGCVNMRIPDAKLLYDWATPIVTDPNVWSTPATSGNPGTLVVIYGTPPAQ